MHLSDTVGLTGLISANNRTGVIVRGNRILLGNRIYAVENGGLCGNSGIIFRRRNFRVM